MTTATATAAQSPDPAAQGRPDIKGVVPYLALEDARGAVAFYERAFAARTLALMPAEDGERLMHACLAINDGHLMLSSSFPEYGCPAQPVAGCTLHIQAADARAWWDRAVAAGCEVVHPIKVEFWGDLYGQLKDPFGVAWSISGPAN